MRVAYQLPLRGFCFVASTWTHCSFFTFYVMLSNLQSQQLHNLPLPVSPFPLALPYPADVLHLCSLFQNYVQTIPDTSQRKCHIGYNDFLLQASSVFASRYLSLCLSIYAHALSPAANPRGIAKYAPAEAPVGGFPYNAV